MIQKSVHLNNLSLHKQTLKEGWIHIIISSKNYGIICKDHCNGIQNPNPIIPQPIWNTNLAVHIYRVFLPCTLAMIQNHYQPEKLNDGRKHIYFISEHCAYWWPSTIRASAGIVMNKFGWHIYISGISLVSLHHLVINRLIMTVIYTE